MKICKNTKELYSELMKRISYTLDDEVADVVKDVMIDHIITDVYDAYQPTEYIRRGNQSGNDIDSPYDNTNNAGLFDPNNIISTTDEEGGLEVVNVTLGSRYYYRGNKRYISKNAEKPIAEIIETGAGYDVRSPGKRPFIKNTHDELKDYGFHIKAMKQGLQKRGLEVK